MGTEQQAIPCESVEVETDVKTCEKRFDKQREKRERIVHYLRHGKHLDGLNKNQQRVVGGQAKTYTLDESEFIFLVTANNHLNVIFSLFNLKNIILIFKHVYHA